MGIYLYGALRKRFGKNINAIVHSGIELLKAAEANRPGFRNAINKKQKYIMVRGDTLKKGKEVVEEEIEMKFSEKDWHLIPVPAGCGSTFVTILGAVLFIAGAVLTAYGFGVIGVPMMGIGMGMMSAGIAQMMAPSPATNDYAKKEVEERPSYLFDGPVNTVEPGLTIPLAYGETFIGSVFISGGLQIVDEPIA